MWRCSTSMPMSREFPRDPKISVGQFLEGEKKGLTVLTFKRVNLNQD